MSRMLLCERKSLKYVFHFLSERMRFWTACFHMLSYRYPFKTNLFVFFFSNISFFCVPRTDCLSFCLFVCVVHLQNTIEYLGIVCSLKTNLLYSVYYLHIPVILLLPHKSMLLACFWFDVYCCVGICICIGIGYVS